MKCSLCEQRKGKRSCPAKSTLICPQCCGEKRILHIDCPETCEYLKIGRGHEVRAQRARHLSTTDPALLEKRRRVFNNLEDLLAEIEFFLAEERQSNHSLLDKEVAEALDLLLETLRTEQKGVIYERTSNDPGVEGLRRRLKVLLDGHLRPTKERRRRLRISEVIECLEVVRDFLSSDVQAGTSAQSYVNFLARLLPRSRHLTDSGSSIIIPRR